MTKQIAQLRYLRMTPRKVRMVADLLKGLSANQAEAQLLMQSRRPAKPLLKLLRSAVANAKNNQKLNPEKLVIESIRVDTGPILKRWLPRARGMATPIQRKMSHVTLILKESESLGEARYKIAAPVKKKETREKEIAKAPKKEPGEAEAREKAKGPKFFRKLFNRKAV